MIGYSEDVVWYLTLPTPIAIQPAAGGGFLSFALSSMGDYGLAGGGAGKRGTC